MRLYSMYYVCKNYINIIRNMKVSSRTVNGKNCLYLTSWKEKSKVLNELANVEPLREKTRKVYDSIPVIYCDVDEFEISDSMAKTYEKRRSELLNSMETVIELYELVNPQRDSNEKGGIDIMLPRFKNLGEFSDCLKDLNFVITQCPYLRSKDEEIKFQTIDVGSIWLTLVAVGASCTILMNIGKIVDQAVKIKSHIATIKMQEEMLRSMKAKNEIAEETIDFFKRTKDLLFQKSLDELEKEIEPLKDGEESDKVKRSLEKLGYWMDKGMQIYSSLDAPKEVQDVFPKQQELSFILTDDAQKLIEKKE